MDGWGLGYAALHERNRWLIYSAVSGWGLDGPMAGEPAIDEIGLMRQAGLRQNQIRAFAHEPEQLRQRPRGLHSASVRLTLKPLFEFF